MYQISVETKFSAAHQLKGYRGNCEHIHGHNWVVIARISTPKLDEIGLAFDFKVLQHLLNTVVYELDHQFLNKIKPFKKMNPSSENIARYIFESLKERLPSDILLLSIEVKESDKFSVTYSDESQ